LASQFNATWRLTESNGTLKGRRYESVIAERIV
jgi:hypothetical protein